MKRVLEAVRRRCDDGWGRRIGYAMVIAVVLVMRQNGGMGMAVLSKASKAGIV